MRQKEMLIVSMTILMTIFAWIAADIIHIANTEKVKAITPSVSKPINVNIDLEVFKILESKN